MNNTLIVTFVDSKYFYFFNLFYEYFEKLNMENLLVVCLDKETFSLLEKNEKIQTILKPYNIEEKTKFWQFRLNVINELFKKHKQNIIHTDSDCFWFKNIVEEMEKHGEDYDMIGSVSYGFPPDIAKQWGFVFCCGFYFIKYTEKNSTLIDRIQDQNIDSVDDQVLFNHYLKNNKKNMREIIENNIIDKIFCLEDDTKVGIIRDTIISRKPKKGLYCFHPYLSFNGIEEKKQQLEEEFNNFKKIDINEGDNIIYQK